MAVQKLTLSLFNIMICFSIKIDANVQLIKKILSFDELLNKLLSLLTN
jgi:hypothetical protein